MRQFINANNEAFADLEHRATGHLIQFKCEETPTRAVPRQARVGFEVNPHDGSAILYVEKGIRYTGQILDVRQWFEDGEKHFSSFGHLMLWIREVLGPCYAPVPEELTDVVAVEKELRTESVRSRVTGATLFQELRCYVRGQDEALRTLTQRITGHLGRQIHSRPLSLFAVGPTGVGKTKTAESVSSALKALDPEMGYGYVRLDMSEYQESHHVSKLLGAPPSYVGYGDGSQFVNALRKNARTVVLFDEIEKAHPNVLQALMNAIDAGRLAAPAGRGASWEIDCRPAIFFFTSNLDSARIIKDLEEQKAFGSPEVVDKVCRVRLRASGIPPEIVGRFSSFLIFRPLDERSRVEIVAMAIEKIATEYGLRLRRIAPSVVAAILRRAGSDGFGMRPYEYVVDGLLGNMFSESAAIHSSLPLELRGGPPFECVPFCERDEYDSCRGKSVPH